MVDDGDDDDLSGFLLGLATSHAAKGRSWVLDFIMVWMVWHQQAFAYLPPLVTLYDMQDAGKHSSSILLNTKLQGASEYNIRNFKMKIIL